MPNTIKNSLFRGKKRRRDPELAKGLGQIATPLSIPTEGGLQKLNCANTEGIFRIIQSIPSPKAEPSLISIIWNFRIVQSQGGRKVSRGIDHYNLDVIIFVR